MISSFFFAFKIDQWSYLVSIHTDVKGNSLCFQPRPSINLILNVSLMQHHFENSGVVLWTQVCFKTQHFWMQYRRFIHSNMNLLLYFSIGDIFLTSPLVTAKVGREDNKNLSFRLSKGKTFILLLYTFYHFLSLWQRLKIIGSLLNWEAIETWKKYLSSPAKFQKTKEKPFLLILGV